MSAAVGAFPLSTLMWFTLSLQRKKRTETKGEGGEGREKEKRGRNSLVKTLSGMMSRSWREGQDEIRRDLEWEMERRREGKILEGREVLL